MKTKNGLEAWLPFAAATVSAFLPFFLIKAFGPSLYRVTDAAHFLVFHNIAEFFSIMVSLSLFGVGWFTYDQSKDSHALFLSTAFLAIGLTDFMHALSYAGMPDFFTPNAPNKSTSFWIAARFLTAASFLASARIYPESRGFTKSRLMTAALLIPFSAFIGIVYFPEYLPATFVEGIGLTPFKEYSEYLIILIFFAAAAAYRKRMENTGERSLNYFVIALIFCMGSEFAFAFYSSVFDTYNVLGHLYKIAAFYMIYKGIFSDSVTAPYRRLLAEVELRKILEKEIGRHRDNLEDLVAQRTAELESANEKLKELDQLKSMFIASMSHELRTPLNSIIGFTGIMLQGMAGEVSNEQKKQLSIVKESADHLLNLVNDVIDVSKIEAGRVEVSMENFDLSELVREVADSLRVAAESKRLFLETDVPEYCQIESDRKRIRQILVNLVGNAVKFTERGKVSILMKKQENGICIEVSDTGIGIGKADMEKLFQPFSRISNESRKEGTGLGLYLSKKLADLLGGTISVESEPGKRSVFSIFLPENAK